MDGYVADSRIPDTTELLDVIDALADALETHHEWLWSIQRAIVCAEPTGPVCDFERWVRTALTLGGLGRPDDLAALAAHHEAVHAAASRLLSHARNQGAPPTRIYDDFLAARKAFKTEALRIQRSLWSETCLVDSLTGLRNRHGMMMELRKEQQRAGREGRSCVVALMDIDHFKVINDSHGHAMGDAVLLAVTRLVAGRLRPYDRIYRYGGEEFLICLPDTGVQQAHGIIERLREEIAERPVRVGTHGVVVTVSFGLAEVEVDASVDESIRRADRALYAAKRNGRNRVVAAES